MTLDEIIEVTGVTSRNTIKAWMRGEHPRITEPFPAPVTKGGIGKGARRVGWRRRLPLVGTQ